MIVNGISTSQRLSISASIQVPSTSILHPHCHPYTFLAVLDPTGWRIPPTSQHRTVLSYIHTYMHTYIHTSVLYTIYTCGIHALQLTSHTPTVLLTCIHPLALSDHPDLLPDFLLLLLLLLLLLVDGSALLLITHPHASLTNATTAMHPGAKTASIVQSSLAQQHPPSPLPELSPVCPDTSLSLASRLVAVAPNTPACLPAYLSLSLSPSLCLLLRANLCSLRSASGPAPR